MPAPDRNAGLAGEPFGARTTASIAPLELERRLVEGEELVLVDVREVEDFAQGHLPGAISLPPGQWPVGEGLHRDVCNVLYGDSHAGHLAATAAAELAGRGYPVLELAGGIEAWKADRLPLER
ncbi:MAG TPA: rhodanese-like domain-containing protein [Candidatus Limnocylindria bacterium]|nr:rhodanese-like domain-containing protein [Candidatus Limnocylindria bacterium]